ncbi:hypothetical protein ZBT109_2067 [Zymobacter palmae]|uniref:Uncharacterized protein n=1 Tax=Zymobacter palmae TaxID=33074 RepID=A0A348HGQ9_9GAMM|nr:hypothetical protein ZBT109_2067 [Zymobacter palmae]
MASLRAPRDAIAIGFYNCEWFRAHDVETPTL